MDRTKLEHWSSTGDGNNSSVSFSRKSNDNGKSVKSFANGSYHYQPNGGNIIVGAGGGGINWNRNNQRCHFPNWTTDGGDYNYFKATNSTNGSTGGGNTYVQNHRGRGHNVNNVCRVVHIHFQALAFRKLWHNF